MQTETSEIMTGHVTANVREDVVDGFKTGMRMFASGVTLLTAHHGGEKGGLIATAVNSVSMDPPTILACVNKNASAHSIIDDSNRICINILSEQDKEIVSVFSDALKRGERFKEGKWGVMHSNNPYLTTALSAFDCKVVEKITSGSHTIFIAEVHEVYNNMLDEKPLVYMNRGFCKLENL